MAYCAKEDLLTGDIPLAGKYGGGDSFVDMAADEIDAEIGHIYVTPVVIEDVPANRPAKLLLKKINRLLASGRIILDQAAGTEDDSLHAYGYAMWKEATDLLSKIRSQAIPLTGAPQLESTDDDDNTGPSIVQQDSQSLVQGFYETYGRALYPPLPGQRVPIRPYDVESGA